MKLCYYLTCLSCLSVNRTFKLVCRLYASFLNPAEISCYHSHAIGKRIKFRNPNKSDFKFQISIHCLVQLTFIVCVYLTTINVYEPNYSVCVNFSPKSCHHPYSLGNLSYAVDLARLRKTMYLPIQSVNKI